MDVHRLKLFCSTWNLPGRGLEPVSSVLAGGFLPVAPPGSLALGF